MIKLFIHKVRFKVLKMGYNYSTYHEISELKEGSDIVITTLDRFKKIREKG